MKKVYLLFWLFCVWNGLAQKPVLMNTFELKADVFVGYDALGAIYSITNNVLTKQFGEQKWQYKNLQLGKITKVDLQNPLKIVLFYQDFNAAILVDNQLNETANINLNNSTNPIVAIAIGLAAGNRLWIYNNLSQKIGLYEYSKREFKNLTIPFTNNVTYYESGFNYFQWIDEEGNSFRCDVYGKIDQMGNLPSFDQIQWISDTLLLFKKGNELYEYNFKDKKSTLVEIDKKTFKNFTYKDQILSIFTDNGITNYKIAVP
jgi:hypothetical protein